MEERRHCRIMSFDRALCRSDHSRGDSLNFTYTRGFEYAGGVPILRCFQYNLTVTVKIDGSEQETIVAMAFPRPFVTSCKMLIMESFSLYDLC